MDGSVVNELPGVKVVGMELHRSQADIVELVEAGVSGFIMKDARAEEYVLAVRMVAEGTNVIPPLLTNSLFSRVITRASTKDNNVPATRSGMTKREQEIVAFIADGLSNKGIGGKLNISPNTVRCHVHSILRKLKMNSRRQISS
jgi:DNA-binding NarL/FixJ family response regulator